MSNEVKRDGFGSKIGIIAAAAGSAIGLGNIWKFPYITGENGGAAFILVYLICIALIGLPVMVAEFTIGRRAQKNAVGSYRTLGSGGPWFLGGFLGVITAFIILAYYGVVAGWTIKYVIFSLGNNFSAMNTGEISELFGDFISRPVEPIIYQIIFMAFTSFIVFFGIKTGIERASKILMPLLLVLILLLDIRALTLPGASAGFNFLFKPEWSRLSATGVLEALGHAFFTLSLGMGTMITYGSYIRKKENLVSTAFSVTIADTVIALLAGLAIFPAVFSFGVEPGAGPGLVFVTLPQVFNQITGGYFMSIFFFILLALAALTSSISILEVVVAYLDEEFKIKRHVATIGAAAVITLMGIPTSLGFGKMSGVTLFGYNFFDAYDKLASNFLMPLGGLVAALFVGWGIKWDIVEDELTNGGELKGKVTLVAIKIFKHTIRFIAPVAVLIVFLYKLGAFNAIIA